MIKKNMWLVLTCILALTLMGCGSKDKVKEINNNVETVEEKSDNQVNEEGEDSDTVVENTDNDETKTTTEEKTTNNTEETVVLQIIYSFMLHFIYNHFQDYPKCHITLFKPDYAHKILLSKNEAHYLTRMRLLTARTFGFSVTYD